MMNMGKPDNIPRLNEQMAIELGANLLGETIVFVSAAAVILFEYSRQVRKEAAKEAERVNDIVTINNRITDLAFQVESQDAHVRRLMHVIAELESNAIRKPWKGSSKLASTDAATVTKEAAKPSNVKPDKEKGR